MNYVSASNLAGAASQVTLSDVAGIKAFQQGLGAGQSFRRGAILHGGSARPLGENLYAMPWGWLLPKDGYSDNVCFNAGKIHAPANQ